MGWSLEKLLLDFIGTLDASFKNRLEEAGSASGVSTLTVSQLGYIDAVYTLGEPSLTELANKLAVTKASVTVGVHKLVSRGYVVKTQSDEDKRVFRVGLTEVGEKLMKAKLKTLERHVAAIRAALTQDEAEQLEATLGKLTKHLKNI